MEVSNIILQYLKIFISWPVVTLVLVISFINLFREPISDFIRRLTRGEFGGFKVQATSPTEQKKEAKDIPQIQSDNELENYVKDNPKEAIKNNYRYFQKVSC